MIPSAIQVSLHATKPSFESVLNEASKDYSREKRNLHGWQSTKEFFESYFSVSSVHKKRKGKSRFDFFYEIFLGKCNSFRPSIYYGENLSDAAQKNYVGVNFYLPRMIPVKGDLEPYSRKKEDAHLPWSQSENGSVIFSAINSDLSSFFIKNPLETYIKSKYLSLVPSKDSFAMVAGARVNLLLEDQPNPKNGVILGDGTLTDFFNYLEIKNEMQKVIK